MEVSKRNKYNNRNCSCCHKRFAENRNQERYEPKPPPPPWTPSPKQNFRDTMRPAENREVTTPKQTRLQEPRYQHRSVNEKPQCLNRSVYRPPYEKCLNTSVDHPTNQKIQHLNGCGDQQTKCLKKSVDHERNYPNRSDERLNTFEKSKYLNPSIDHCTNQKTRCMNIHVDNEINDMCKNRSFSHQSHCHNRTVDHSNNDKPLYQNITLAKSANPKYLSQNRAVDHATNEKSKCLTASVDQSNQCLYRSADRPANRSPDRTSNESPRCPHQALDISPCPSLTMELISPCPSYLYQHYTPRPRHAHHLPPSSDKNARSDSEGADGDGVLYKNSMFNMSSSNVTVKSIKNPEIPKKNEQPEGKDSSPLVIVAREQREQLNARLKAKRSKGDIDPFGSISNQSADKLRTLVRSQTQFQEIIEQTTEKLRKAKEDRIKQMHSVNLSDSSVEPKPNTNKKKVINVKKDFRRIVEDVVRKKVVGPMIRRVQRMYLKTLKEEMDIVDELQRMPSQCGQEIESVVEQEE